MTLPQIEDAFGHRFDKLYHAKGAESSIKKKYLQKLPEEAAGHIRLMATSLNMDYVSDDFLICIRLHPN